MRRKVHGNMELWPNSLNRSNQFCNCLIWSLTGSILVKPNNGDQERFIIIWEIYPAIQEEYKISYHAPKPTWSGGSIYGHTYLIWSLKHSNFNSYIAFSLWTRSALIKLLGRFQRSYFIPLNHPDSKELKPRQNPKTISPTAKFRSWSAPLQSFVYFCFLSFHMTVWSMSKVILYINRLICTF